MSSMCVTTSYSQPGPPPPPSPHAHPKTPPPTVPPNPPETGKTREIFRFPAGVHPLCRFRRPDLRAHVLACGQDAVRDCPVRPPGGASGELPWPLRDDGQLALQDVHEQRRHRQPLAVSVVFVLAYGQIWRANGFKVDTAIESDTQISQADER